MENFHPVSDESALHMQKSTSYSSRTDFHFLFSFKNLIKLMDQSISDRKIKLVDGMDPFQSKSSSSTPLN